MAATLARVFVWIIVFSVNFGSVFDMSWCWKNEIDLKVKLKIVIPNVAIKPNSLQPEQSKMLFYEAPGAWLVYGFFPGRN
uniref:Uncharacterized protein n=1 Tax=Strigamia maritima TaxID=126957 RepID=T1IZP3_STRMM